jgi:tetratricopeptide (TPR) repeat protein
MNLPGRLLSRLADRNRSAARLAQHAALAARIEPALLRHLRHRLLPDADASAEIDLWNSPLVRSSSPTAMVFSASVTSYLRGRLASDPDALSRTYNEITVAHRKSPDLLRLEEELVYLGFGPSSEKSDGRIRQLLGQIAAAMKRGEHRVRGLSSWLMTSMPTWPARVLATDEARALALVACTRVPRLAAVGAALPGARGLRLVRSLLPEGSKLPVSLRRTRMHLEVQRGRHEGWHDIEIPAAIPKLEIFGRGTIPVSDEKLCVRVDDQHVVRVRTGDGQQYALRPLLSALEQLARLVVRIRLRGSHMLTGVLVTPKTVVTIASELADAQATDVEVIFSRPEERWRVEWIARDTQSNLALLTMVGAAAGRPALQVAETVAADVEWRSAITVPDEGRTHSLEGEVLTVAGDLLTSKLHPPSDLPMLAAFVGAPLVSGDQLIGLMLPDTRGGLAVAGPAIARFVRNARVPHDPVVEQIIGLSQQTLADFQHQLAALASRGGLTAQAVLNSAQALLGRGRLEPALVVLGFAPTGHPHAERTRAMILSKLGRHQQAIALFEHLRAEGYADAETLANYGGVRKRLWSQSQDRRELEHAYALYREAYQRSNDHYPGINAAALALYLGDAETSRSLAKEIAEQLAARAPDTHDLWSRATFAEALLLKGDLPRARLAYRAAAGSGASRPQDVAVMRRQARLDLTYLELPPNSFDDVLIVPGVLGFAGQPTDAADQTRVIFPESHLAALRRWLRAHLQEENVAHGYCCAARGSDLVFIDEVLRRGGQVTVFLPEDREEFRRHWVGFGWDGTFDELLRHNRVTVRPVTTPADDDRLSSYLACQRAAASALHQQAEILDQRPRVVILWDLQQQALVRAIWSEAGALMQSLDSLLATRSAPAQGRDERA